MKGKTSSGNYGKIIRKKSFIYQNNNYNALFFTDKKETTREKLLIRFLEKLLEVAATKFIVKAANDYQTL